MYENVSSTDPIAELTNKARLAVEAAQVDLAAKEAAVLESRRIARELERELESIESATRRYFSTGEGNKPAVTNPAAGDLIIFGFPSPSAGPESVWASMKRPDAVMKAVRHLTQVDGYATPDSIRGFLSECGREDDKNSIGSTLSRLRSDVGKVRALSRGRWVPTDVEVSTS